MIHQKLLIGGVYVSVRQDAILGWRATVITAPKHAKAVQERAEAIASLACSRPRAVPPLRRFRRSPDGIATISPEDAAKPLEASECPLVKK